MTNVHFMYLCIQVSDSFLSQIEPFIACYIKKIDFIGLRERFKCVA